VGGRTQNAANERLIRFTFPERPGALLKFLQALHPGWNISLFHYRNQGADYGRVLVGLQIGEDQVTMLETLLNTLGYPWVEETDNPVYRLFLG
jgi:threonine dehydratase